MRLYDWTVTMEAGSDSSGATCTAAGPAQCTTALVTNGVQGNLPTEHVGGTWGDGTDSFGKYMTQEGTGTFLRWDANLGTNAFTSRMKLAVTKLAGSAATFEVRVDAEKTHSDRSAALSHRNNLGLSFGYFTKRNLCGPCAKGECPTRRSDAHS